MHEIYEDMPDTAYLIESILFLESIPESERPDFRYLQKWISELDRLTLDQKSKLLAIIGCG